ncbi:hypothetical protein ACSSWA_07210 [Melioribacter sp. Ez-97]
MNAGEITSPRQRRGLVMTNAGSNKSLRGASEANDEANSNEYL